MLKISASHSRESPNGHKVWSQLLPLSISRSWLANLWSQAVGSEDSQNGMISGFSGWNGWNQLFPMGRWEFRDSQVMNFFPVFPVRVFLYESWSSGIVRIVRIFQFFFQRLLGLLQRFSNSDEKEFLVVGVVAVWNFVANNFDLWCNFEYITHTTDLQNRLFSTNQDRQDPHESQSPIKSR